MYRITDITGAWYCQEVMGYPDRMYVGVYNGLYLLEKQSGEWRVLCKIDGFQDSCRLFEQESAKVLWIYNSGSITRVELSEELTRQISVKSYGVEEGFPVERQIYVAKIEGRVYFTTPHGIYKYNVHKDMMEPCSDLNNLLNGAVPYTRLLEYHERLISLSPHEICIANLGTYKRGANTSINPIRQSFLELGQDYEAIIPLSDSLMVIPNEEGFALFTVPEVRHRQDLTHSVYIRNMYLTYPKDSLVYTANFLGKKPSLLVDYTSNSVRFEYGLAFFDLDGDDIRFQYRLNKGVWSDYTTVRIKEYSNLSEGDYTFEVKVIYPDGTTSSDELSFRILPPWYRSVAAYVCYIILAFLGLWYIYRWDDIRVKRKKSRQL